MMMIKTKKRCEKKKITYIIYINGVIEKGISHERSTD